MFNNYQFHKFVHYILLDIHTNNFEDIRHTFHYLNMVDLHKHEHLKYQELFFLYCFNFCKFSFTTKTIGPKIAMFTNFLSWKWITLITLFVWRAKGFTISTIIMRWTVKLKFFFHSFKNNNKDKPNRSISC